MTEVVRVNFGKPMGVFPLPEAVLLPHAIQPLHIFEPRYRSLIEDSLSKTKQFALACFRTSQWQTNADETPTLRPAVCIGQIVHHDELPDGRHNILLHGVCRARITRLIEPDGERLYRMARLVPLESIEEEPPPMPEVRESLRKLLASPCLQRLRSVDTVKEWFERDDVTTHALLELIGFALVHDHELRYRLLAEPSPERRARIITSELARIDRLITRADTQPYRSWPKGMSWN